MKMYRTYSYGCVVEEIDVERVTEKSVYINGSRSSLKSEWRQHFNSFNEAKEYLIGRANKSIEGKEYSLDMAKAFLKNVEKQTAPIKL